MPDRLRVLLIEDNAEDAELVIIELTQGGFDPLWRHVQTAEELGAALAEQRWDIVLSDYSIPGFGAMLALAMCRAVDLDLPFVVISGTIGEELAVASVRAGASDYLLKGNLTRLGLIVERELREAGNRRAKRRAESSVSLLAAIVESSDAAIISNTLEGFVTSWNPASEGLFGWPAADAIGQNISLLVPPDKLVELTSVMERLGQGDRFEQFETVRLHRDGSRLDVAITLSPIRDRDERLIGVSTVARDIRERKQAEEALRKSEQRYRTLVAATSAIVWDSPASGEFDSEQPSWTAFTGQTVEQHRGWGWLDAIHPDDRAKSGRAWARAISSRETYEIEHRVLRRDGVYREMSVRAVPVFEANGEIREWVGVHTDVTERREAEQAIFAGQQRLKHVLASSPAVLFTLTIADERIQGMSWISDNLYEMLGHDPDDALAANWWAENIHADERSEIIATTHEQLLRDGRAAHEYRFRHGDGEYRWTRGEIRVIRSPDGQTSEAVGAWTDITARKLLEVQFQQAQKMEAFGQLAGGVAHDFNNLLTIINGYSEMLLQRLPIPDPSRSLVAEILKAGERSAGLTRQLLAFSRRQVLATRVLNLNEVVADTDKMLRRLIGEDVRLTTTLESNLAPVRVDSGQIEQVLLNLAVNARDAMPKGGRLTIETRNVVLDEGYANAHKDARAGAHVLLSVSDTGTGIPPKVMLKIFEPFFSTKEPGKGTGLGLATVYGIINQSGGHITVASEMGVGTTFNIYLPQVERPTNAAKSPSQFRTPPRGTETVLLTEDEASVRALGSQILAGCGYVVLQAVDGDDALRVAAGHIGPIHLLVTDVVMPGMGGRDLAGQLSERHPETRVLFMSGYTDDAVIRHGVLREGMNFLQKPFSVAALAFKVREVLDAPFENGHSE